MTRAEFAEFVVRSLENAICFAEEKTGKKLPRALAFQWMGKSHPIIKEGIVDCIADRLFVDPEHIYPCVDIGPADILADGSLLIRAEVFNYAPRPFGKNWSGTDGPFLYAVWAPLYDGRKEWHASCSEHGQ